MQAAGESKRAIAIYRCQGCGQRLAKGVSICPVCGKASIKKELKVLTDKSSLTEETVDHIEIARMVLVAVITIPIVLGFFILTYKLLLSI